MAALSSTMTDEVAPDHLQEPPKAHSAPLNGLLGSVRPVTQSGTQGMKPVALVGGPAESTSQGRGTKLPRKSRADAVSTR